MNGQDQRAGLENLLDEELSGHQADACAFRVMSNSLAQMAEGNSALKTLAAVMLQLVEKMESDIEDIRKRRQTLSAKTLAAIVQESIAVVSQAMGEARNAVRH